MLSTATTIHLIFLLNLCTYIVSGKLKIVTPTRHAVVPFFKELSRKERVLTISFNYEEVDITSEVCFNFTRLATDINNITVAIYIKC